MKHARLDQMTGGWFVGSFQPTALHTEACEVAVKKHKAGDKDEAHYHKIATEVTLVLSGRVRMAGAEYVENDIIVLEPGDASSFEALTDAVLIVVKEPSARDDKFEVL